MAAILEKLLEKHISPGEVVKWMETKSSEDSNVDVLAELHHAQNEFLPFFINFLRDQAQHLLQSGRSASNTPAKTPTPFKTKRRSLELGQNTSTPAHSNKRNSTNRVQLFASPLDSKVSFQSDGSLLESPGSTFDASQISNDSMNMRRGGSASKKNNSYRVPCHTENASKGRHSHQQSTPDPNKSRRQRHNASLAEFFVNTSDQDLRKKRSPLSNKKEEASPSPLNRRRSGGSKHKKQQGETRRQSQGSQEKPPVFTLADFPSLGGDNASPGQSADRCSSLPDGAKVITSSRRVTTTLLTSQPLESRNNPAFASAALESPQPGSLIHRNKFQPSPQAGSATTSLADERKLLKECKGRKLNLDSFKESGDQECAVPTWSRKPQTPTDRNLSAELAGHCVTPTPSRVVALTPVKSRTPETMAPVVTPTKNLLERLSSVTEIVHADRKAVTYEEQLTLMADLYSGCLDALLVPNVTVELYFVIQLLTCRGGELDLPPDISKDADEIHYFSSVHNAVYFAVRVLSKQTRFLQLLEKGLLKMLSENQRVVEFCPELKDNLDDIYEKAPTKVTSPQSFSPIGGVSFQADTDNVKNFPSERVFHVFKKQRDMFYELIREWEENHMSAGWSMLEAQADRIRHLVNYRTELANHIHLARLFQSQLIQMCKGDNSFKSEGDDENIALLSQLKQTNPAKFKRLQSRFITPSSCGGPCPLPSFPGCQEFFRNFIYAAASCTFNQHLTDGMAFKLSELNTTPFSDPSDSQADHEEDAVDVEDRETLAHCLLTLRLLGKFLGFISFLPYQTPEVLPDSTQLSYIAMRNKSSPLLDVLLSLKTAQSEGRTLITVPWVVEYLSMMDQFALQLDYYQQVALVLLAIYREASAQFQQKANHTQFLIITVLGWLFELSVFSEGFFFSDAPLDTTPDRTLPKGCLDNLNLVDQQMLYSCCPYLGEMRSLLVDFAVGMSSRSSAVRKITPILAQTEVSGTLTDKQLQNHLEENFFHNHPASLKRTVEFVGDRVASNFIKKFRTQSFPTLLEEGHSGARQIAQRVTGETLHSRSMSKASQQILDLSASLTERARKFTDEDAQRYCPSCSSNILPQLLPEDVSPAVLQVCVQIASRTALLKIYSWLGTHINTNMFKRELMANFEKHLKALNNPNSKVNQGQVSQSVKESVGLSQPIRKQETTKEPISGHETTEEPIRKEQSVAAIIHDEECISPSDAIIMLKSILKTFCLGKEKESLSSCRVLEAFTEVQHMFSCRLDITAPVVKALGKLIVNLTYSLILQQPETWSDDLQCHLLEMFTTILHSTSAFDYILCPKHLYLIETSCSPQLSWKKLSNLVRALVESKLLTVSAISDGCKSLLETDITEGSFGNLVDLMCSVTLDLHKHGSNAVQEETFVNTLKMLAAVSQDMNECKVKLQMCLDEVISCNHLSNNSGADQDTVEKHGACENIDNKVACDALSVETKPSSVIVNSSITDETTASFKDLNISGPSVQTNDTFTSANKCSACDNNNGTTKSPEVLCLDADNDIVLTECA